MIDYGSMDKEDQDRFIQIVLMYPQSKSPYEIVDFIELGIPPDYVDEHKSHDAKDIIVGFFLGIDPEIPKSEMPNICAWEGNMYELMGNGMTAVAIRLIDNKGKIASPVMKIGKSLSEEYRMWQKVRDSPIFLHPDFAKSGPIEVICHETGGSTLANQIERLLAGMPVQLFYAENVFRDVFRQLDELRIRDIYYADLKPQNVLMKDRIEGRMRFDIFAQFPKEDRCCLIDLGESSDDPLFIPRGNRRYGGPDLMSLGQLVYKSIIWRDNLFNDYSAPSSLHPDEIKKQRELFCTDPKVRQKYLDKVDEIVTRKDIAGLIKICLTAGTTLGENPPSCPKEIRDAAYDEVRAYYNDNFGKEGKFV